MVEDKNKEPFAGSKEKEPASAFGAQASDERKLKPDVISGKLERAVAIAKGMNPDLLSKAEYERKLKRFEADVKTAYPDLDEETIRLDFEGMTAREERWKNVKEGEPYVGMNPLDFPKNDLTLRPLSMEDRLRLDTAQAVEAMTVENEQRNSGTPGFREGSKESIERAKQSGTWDQAAADKVRSNVEKSNAGGQAQK